MKFDLNVNGAIHHVDVAEDMPLLWVLRDVLGLTGTKYGCGKGLCGACTVHLNDQAILSCLIPIAGVVGQRITTIEGLAPPRACKLLQAWQQFDVPQCGYCQAGQLMSAAALLNVNPKPTDQQIDDAMMGNLCRCGTYPRIHRAIRSVIE